MKIGSIIKDALILFAITLILGLALSGAKVITQPAVDKAAAEAKIKAFSAVCDGYASHEDITEEAKSFAEGSVAKLSGDESVLIAKDAGGEIIGYIVQCTSKGFGGPLNLIIGFDKDGKVSGVQYANTPSETPGVGMKTTKPDFLAKWVGRSAFDVSEVDTISGATISSTAFKEAVSMACKVIDNVAKGGK